MFYTNINASGNYINYRGRDGKKEVRKKIKGFQPVVWQKNINRAENAIDETVVGIYGEPLVRQEFSSMSKCRQFINEYEGHLRLFGTRDFAVQWMEQNTRNTTYNPEDVRIFLFDIEAIDMSGTFKGFPDPTEAPIPIVSISLIDSYDKDKIHLWYWGDEIYSFDDDIVVHWFSDEKNMMADFLDYWVINCPDIISGWNITSFDIPYVYFRLKKLFGEDVASGLSPWNNVWVRTFHTSYGKKQTTVKLTGIANCDYLECYKNFTYTARESYSLDFIAGVELGEAKLEYDGTITSFARTDFKKFLEYNIHDTRIVKRLDDKMKLLELVMAIAYSTNTNYELAFTTVKLWEAILYQAYIDSGVVIPLSHGFDEDAQYGWYPGAFVKDPQTGLNDEVLSFDLTSLYPSIIMGFNLSVETLREQHPHFKGMRMDEFEKNVDSLLKEEVDTTIAKEKNYSLAANGWMFDNSKQGMFGSLMERFFAQRKEMKSKMLEYKKKLEEAKHSGDPSQIEKYENLVSKYNNLQMAFKILLNSFYGALGNEHFLFYDVRLASAVTVTGQLVIQWADKVLNRFMRGALKTDKDYVLYGDTDSVYISISEFVRKYPDYEKWSLDKKIDFIDKVAKEIIEPVIANGYNNLKEYLNMFRQTLHMKREVISTSSFFVTKKRYAMLVHDSEGVRYDPPQLKIMGLEIVRSSSPPYMRKLLRDAVWIVLTEKDEKKIQSFVKKVKDTLTSNSSSLDPNDLAFPRTVNGIEKYYDPDVLFKKRTPKHVKAAIVYNELLQRNPIEGMAEINSGDKIRFIDLKENNPTGFSVIAWHSHDNFPSALIDREYIDYSQVYESAFLKPLTGILDSIGWEATEPTTFNLGMLFE